MSDASLTEELPQLIQIASITLGPQSQCRDKAWDLLVDFKDWQEVIPGATALELEHANPAGRGTVLSLQFGNRDERWSISHWHPGQRLELIQTSAQSATGLRFDLDAAQDSEHVNMGISLQVESHGIYRLAQPITRALTSRRMRSRFTPLLQHLQERLLA